ncbi:glycosyltransferase family 2 protein [bacterium]|nr:glycosyltransferase family 2 protein [bacterium]RQV93782.1 MAG: glycosyltransferase [bacterium]
MRQKINVSIVIPVYNGAATIGRLVDNLIEKLNHFELEIVLVNDHSRDNSEDVCIAIQNKYPYRVSFYSLAKNVGEHNAVLAGLNHATGDYIVIMDDDFQNPPSEVIKLISTAMHSDYDVIYTYYDKKKHTNFRNLGSWFNDKIANIMLKKPKDLYLSSFKLLNKFLASEIIKYKSPFPYIDGLILQITDNIGKIKVEHHKREAGRSNYTIKKLISLWINMFTNFSIIPLRVSIVLGFIFSIYGLIYGIIIIIERILNPDMAPGLASLIVTVSILAGVQLIAIGMIGEYVGRIFISQNKKPQYTIKRQYPKKIKPRKK